MTKIKQQVIELLQDIPDDKVIYILDILRGLKGISDSNKNEELTENTRKTAIGILNKYANQDLVSQEKDAWGKAVRDKHVNN